MATLSGNWNFQSNFTVDRIIQESYARIGKIDEPLTQVEYQNAQDSLNIVLASWINRGLNLWTIAKGMLTLLPGQNIYNLPVNFVDIYYNECTSFVPVRQLIGTPFASSGIAANAFDSNPLTACTQTAPDGNIGFHFTTPQAISYVGINSFVNNTYTLEIQYSNDNITWYTVNQPIKQNYQAGVDVWIALDAVPPALYWQILETGGSTLNIDELYFDTQGIKSKLLSAVSRYTMLANTNRGSFGDPTIYYVNRLVNPTIQLYPLPQQLTYPYILFNYVSAIQSIDAFIGQNAQVPLRFYAPLCAGLAFELAVKFAPDRAGLLGSIAEDLFSKAAGEDIQKVPTTVTAGLQYYS